MKRVILGMLAFLLAAVCLFALPIEADAATEGYYTYTVSGGKATITDCNTSISGDVTIPATLGGYPVTSIGYDAFYDCSKLTSITIPDSVTSIGAWAFEYCSKLTSITIPDSVTSIGNYAFYDCSSLTSITIPDSVTSIGYYAFYDCSSLTSITIGNGVISIGNDAFDGCSSLTGVYITDIAAWCNIDFFSSDSNPLYYAKKLFLNNELVTDLVIPDGVTSIGDYAFYRCSSLESITIPDSVTSIGYQTFSNCSSLTGIWVEETNPNYCNDHAGALFNKKMTELICLPGTYTGKYTIPDSVTSIGEGAFNGCSSLTSITIPDSVTSIGSSAFDGCSSLTSITIPDSVTSIGGSAFQGCSKLTSITIPDSVTSIGGSAFRGCSSLISITLPDSVTSIGAWAFEYCSKLTSITIPDSVTSIGSCAFYDCSSLTSITIPDSVTSIGYYAFYDCSSLTSITIGNGIISIDIDAFYGCSSLTEVYITDIAAWCNMDFFGSYSNPLYCAKKLFLNNELVTDLAIPDSVTSIGDYAFGGCSSLTSITIPDSVTSIGDDAFWDCSSLTSITIPDSVTSIGDYAFYKCSSLESITIPDGVTSIAEGTFYECRRLTTITIPDSVTSIGECAFSDCSSLTSITIGDSVTSIGYRAFSNCSSLTSITIPDGVTSIAEGTFYECRRLTTITIPDSVTSIGERAFYNCSSLKDLYITDPIAYSSISFGNSYADPRDYADHCHILDENGKEVTEFVVDNTVTQIPAKLFYKCSGLTSITIPDRVTSIGDLAFYGCSSLTTITIPDSVTSIGYSAFWGCSKLTSITIPDSVTSIGYSAFWGCSKLTSITIPASVTSISSSAFYDCSSLTTITIPDSVTSIGNYAFWGCSGLTDVWYGGSQVQKEETDIGTNNDKLVGAFWHYNTCSPDQHVYDNTCDESCNNCGYVRTITHTYDNACDTSCNVCGYTRTITHTYDNACDTSCNVCGHIRSITHTYDNTCDTTCNICGYIRTITHTYSGTDDLTCNVCKESLAPKKPTAETVLDVTITLAKISGLEYSLDGVNWQSSNVFTGLQPATQYRFYQRVAESSSSHVGPASPALIVSTLAQTGTVTYHANGGESAPDSQKKIKGISLTLTAEKPVYAGFTFKGWAIKSYGVVEYQPGDTYTEEADITLYAVWGRACTVCNGTGKAWRTCSSCDGKGYYYTYSSSCCNFSYTSQSFTGDGYGTNYIYKCRACKNICSLNSTYHSCATQESYTCTACGGSKQEKTPHTVTAAPVMKDSTSWSVTLVQMPDMEYSMDSINWQASNIFDGLNPGTEYTFYQRYVENDAHRPATELCDALYASTRASKPKPAAPTISSYSDCQVTLVPIDGGEYSIDGGKTWQTSNVFTNLNPSTKYTFCQRFAAQGELYCSPTSDKTSITTDRRTPGSKPSAPVAVVVTANSIILKTVDGCEYSIDGVNWQTDPAFTDLSCATTYRFWQRYAQTEDSYASTASDPLEVKTDKGTRNPPSKPYVETVDYNRIVLGGDEAYEYSRDLISWQKSPEFEGLAPNTNYMFYRRYAETEYHYASEPSPALVVKTLLQAERIAVTKLPNKTSYQVGQKLDTNGMVVIAYFPDGTSQEVTEYMVSFLAMPGDCTVTVTYHERTTTFTVNVAKASGWVQTDGKWYYYIDDVKKTGWLQLGSTWYYMDGQGVMQTGWQQISGIWYYFKSSGAMVTGWLQSGSIWYYFNASGGMVTGWQQIGGTWYYFKSGGAMATGWLQLGNTWYYFNSSGAMVTGTVTINGKVNKFDASGAWLGEVSQNGWVQEGGKWYYYQNGAKATGWKQVSGKWYYFNTSGVMQTGWLKLGNTWYYFHSSGAMATSPVTLGSKTYRFDASGACLNP